VGLNASDGSYGSTGTVRWRTISTLLAKGQNLAEVADEVSGTFSNRIKEMKNHVMVYLADLGQNGLDWMAKKWQDWGPGITDVANHLKDNLIVIFDSIKQHLRDFVSGWLSSSKDSPSGFWENLGSISRGVYESLLGFFRVLKTSFLDFITGWSDGAEGSPSGFWQHVGSISEQIGQGMLDLFANIKTAFNGFVTGWKSSGDDSPSGFWENLGSKAEGVKDDLIQWFDNIKTAYQGFR
jgi:phage-related protein